METGQVNSWMGESSWERWGGHRRQSVSGVPPRAMQSPTPHSCLCAGRELLASQCQRPPSTVSTRFKVPSLGPFPHVGPQHQDLSSVYNVPQGIRSANPQQLTQSCQLTPSLDSFYPLNISQKVHEKRDDKVIALNYIFRVSQ